MKTILIILVIAVTAFVISCSKSSGDTNNPQQSPPPSCDGINAKFAADIMPIFQTKCATSSNCHGGGSVNGPGPLQDFNAIKAASADIKRVVNLGIMPKDGSLDPLQIEQINCWIDHGAINN